jgi:tRNA(fMet)-specific endonuclease VapC
MQPGLLDTSTLILLARVDAEQLPDIPSISAVTLAELSVGPLVALIAATAISRGLPLHTCNPADFDGIPGLDLRPVAVTP